MESNMRMKEECQAVRGAILHMLRCGGRGHVASALSLVEILSVLYGRIMKFDSRNPRWPERDRCILSKGHGCMALYAVLQRHGFFPEDEFQEFCRPHGILGGHPQYGKVPGVEASTGSLGHGLSIAVGQCLAMRCDGKSACVFVLMGDGECDEGSVWEAALCAGKHGLDNLVALIDYNKLQSYGPVSEVQPLEPLADKWRAFGFDCREVDGHDTDALEKVLRAIPFTPGRPSALICHTVKGKGIASIEGDLNWHHKAKVPDEEIERLLEEVRNA